MTAERRRSDAVLGERDGGAESTVERRRSDAVLGERDGGAESTVERRRSDAVLGERDGGAESTVERRRSDAVLGERDGGAESTVERRRSDAVQQSFLDLDEDLATREAIVEALDETLFVEAGAGSGKTKALVDRVVALVTRARRAHARDRRRHLHREGGGRAARPDPARARGRGPRHRGGRRVPGPQLALDELDGAAVSTLHAFAQRLLAEHPIEAGLPPRIEVLDDIASQLAFEERWTRFVDELLDDPALERTLLLALNADTTLTVLRTLALACNANWDLVAERMGPEPDPPPLDGALAPVIVALTDLHELTGHCRAADDKLLVLLGNLGHVARGARSPRPTSTSSCASSPWARRRGSVSQGRKDNWPGDVPGGVGARPGEGAPAAGRRDRGEARRGRPAAPGVGARTVHTARGRGAPPPRPARVPRPARAGPSGAARPASTGGTSGSGCGRATRACCSTSSRTPIPSSATSPRCWHRARPTPRATAGTSSPVDPGPSVRGRRPQAVDLPVPARRHRRVPPGPLRVRRRAAATSRATSAPPARSSTSSTRCSATSSSPSRSRNPSTWRSNPCASAAPVGPPVVLLGATPELDEAAPPTSCASARRPTSPAVIGTCAARGLAGLAAGHRRDGAVARRVDSVTSPCCSRRAPRSDSSRTRSTPPASRTGPRRRRWSTARARSATCSSCCRRSTTPPTSSRS